MRSTLNRLVMLVSLAALGGVNTTVVAQNVILFNDTFSEMKGHVISQTDGKLKVSGGAATRQVFPFMGTSERADGALMIESLEDHETAGPDEKPGVLAIVYREVPAEAVYSGFAYLGGVTRDKMLTLKEITESPTMEHLKQIKLTFKYRAANAVNADDVGASFGCRLEPNVAESYEKRISFGSIHATAKWRTFEATLDQGENIEAFLKAVTAEHPRAYKLIWSQDGSITNYQTGDTLLIDDVEIVRLP